jgi:hypothetical protein
MTYRVRLLVFFLVLISIPLRTRAQNVARDLVTMVPECAVHQESGSWVPAELSKEGVLRFTYVYEPPKSNPGEYDYKDKQDHVYAAFWNTSKTKGELLQFIWFRSEPRPHLRIINNGEIVRGTAGLDLVDTLWGVWTYEHLMRRLAKLKALALHSIAATEIQSDGVRCDSYAHPHLEWDSQNASAPSKLK